MSARHKTLLWRTLLCAACCVLVAIGAAVWSCGSSLQVRVFDSRFHVLSVKVLRTRNDRFYVGNQFEGCARSFLRDRCHLRVKPLADVSDLYRVASGDGGCTLALRYSCEVTASPVSPEAELVDCSGASLGLGGICMIGRNPYCSFFNLDRGRTNAGDYTLRLKRAGVRVAEVEIKRLPAVLHHPFDIGPNAF